MNLTPRMDTIDSNMQMNTSDYILQFGPKTIDAIMSAVNDSFKIFWDGSISMHKETVHSSTNNK